MTSARHVSGRPSSWRRAARKASPFLDADRMPGPTRRDPPTFPIPRRRPRAWPPSGHRHGHGFSRPTQSLRTRTDGAQRGQRDTQTLGCSLGPQSWLGAASEAVVTVEAAVGPVSARGPPAVSRSGPSAPDAVTRGGHLHQRQGCRRLRPARPREVSVGSGPTEKEASLSPGQTTGK